MGKKKTTFNISKSKNFSEWYSEILQKAEITDVRYGVKGFVVIRPWGARILEKMYKIYESALRATGHDPSFFPTVIPEENFKKEASHVEGFAPEVFWLEGKRGESKLALRPTSETAFFQMYNLWIRSYRDLPLKLYQRATVFRDDTKSTRPLIRGKEFHWIETHNVFATKKEAEAQVNDDIIMTEEIVHKIFGVPGFSMKRPEWDKFPGADYTIASDCLLPDGKLLQKGTTHLLGQNFSKPFNITFIDEKEKEKFAWQTTCGPGMSRILASVLSVHGDDKGLILPYTVSPIQVIIIPFDDSGKKKKVSKAAEEIRARLMAEYIDSDIDSSDKRPGDKFFFWEMKGVPFRIEIGEKELEKNSVTVFVRDTEEKIEISLDTLAEDIKNLGAEYDERLKARADDFIYQRLIDVADTNSLKKAVNAGKIVRFNFCSVDKGGISCAEKIEKDYQARVMGVLADKQEKAKGNCVICSKKANVVAYAGKSY